MKKTAIFIFALAFGTYVANAQDQTKTPNESKSSGTTTSPSPDATNSGNTTTSEGTMNSSSPKSMHNGTKLQLSDLPKAISQSISSQHEGWAPQEVYKIDNQGKTAYEVVVKKNEDEMSLVYDVNGNLLKTEPQSSGGSEIK